MQDLETTNSSAQAWLGNVSFEIDTLPEEDSAPPAGGKYPDLLAHTSVAELATSGTLPCGGGVRCIHLVTRLKVYLMSSMSSGMGIESEPMSSSLYTSTSGVPAPPLIALVVAKSIAYPGVPSLVKVGLLDRRL